MARSVFFSFHYDRDVWRVQNIINMGALERQRICNAQEWEDKKKQGDTAIMNWIEDQMKWKSAVVVLVGAETAERKWVRHEIVHAWNKKKPLVGIRIHGLKDQHQDTDSWGYDPFERLTFDEGGSLADYVTLWTPRGSTSEERHADIRANIISWIDSAYRRP